MTVMTDVVLQTLLAAVMFSTVYVLYLKLSQPVADFLDGYSQVSYSYYILHARVFVFEC